MHWTLFSFKLSETIERADLDPSERRVLLTTLAHAQEHRWDTIRHLPLDGIAAFDPRFAPQWTEWLAHPRYDPYWESLDVARRSESVSVPILHGSGWYDNFLRGHLDLHAALQRSSGKVAPADHRFFIGPWEHLSYISHNTSAAGDRDFGNSARGGPDLLPDLFLGWFDRWLKGAEPSLLPQRPVRYFMMGRNEWRDSDVWPPPADHTRYYLHSGGRANTRIGDGTLDRNAPTGAEPADSYTYDPRDPVPTVGGRCLHREWAPAGVFDQAAVEMRPDVLVYTTAQLSQPLAIAGTVIATLHLSTDVEDSDFTAKLVDVELSGYCANIAEGITRARYRHGVEQEVWLGREVFQCSIDLWDVAHEFLVGHRMRLEISSSNFPRFDRNLNTTANPELGTEADVRTAAHRVWHDARRPSYLELPVITAPMPA